MAELKTTVIKCQMENCGYNKENKCFAMAITVGGPHQMCDTFAADTEKGGVDTASAMVGACKVINCMFNKALVCTVKGVVVGPHEGHPDCLTAHLS